MPAPLALEMRHPLMARLSASVAPEVNTISWGVAFTRAATWALAASTATRAARPGAWLEAGLANTPSRVRQAAMRSATLGSRGVVAA